MKEEGESFDGHHYKIVNGRKPEDGTLERLRRFFHRIVAYSDGTMAPPYLLGGRDITMLRGLCNDCDEYGEEAGFQELKGDVESVIVRYYATKATNHPSTENINNVMKIDTAAGIIMMATVIRETVDEVLAISGSQKILGRNSGLLNLLRAGTLDEDEYESVVELYDYYEIACTRLSFEPPDDDTMYEWERIYSKLCRAVFCR